jgi:hypothetical protein
MDEGQKPSDSDSWVCLHRLLITTAAGEQSLNTKTNVATGGSGYGDSFNVLHVDDVPTSQETHL